MAEDFYNILGVKRSATEAEIRKAYRKLARKHHPDVNPGNDEAEAIFKKIAAAHEVLSDSDKRKTYDEFGEESLASGFDPEKARGYQQWRESRAQGSRATGSRATGSPYEDFDFADIFGFGRGPRGPSRGSDVQAAVQMTLREAIKGGQMTFDVPGRKPVTVRIPPGADNGSTIRLKGKGAPGAEGGPAGDLLIVVQVKPHELVRREGLNLILRLPVTLEEAYNGAVIEVPTFDGPIKLTIPPLSQPGTKLRARGKGVERKSKKGDLLVELNVRLPDVADDKLSEALTEARDLYENPISRSMTL